MHFIEVLRTLALLGTLASAGYYVLCLWSASRFHKSQKSLRSTAPQGFTPAISILKPLKGTDPEIYASFRSHCVQEYPEFEIVFGVSDPNDPAIKLVEQLQQEFPCRAIRLVHCRENLGTNTKVSNLAQMVREARYPYLIVNDSDIRVEPDYLRRVISPLTNPDVGLVTCLYRGIAGPTLGSRLESIGISTDFSAGVLAARQIESGIRFGLGSTLAFRRSHLEAMGGFESIVDYLADDYELGKRIADRGLKVQLSETVVETYLPAYSLGAFVRHQLRWARSVRDSRRWGYLGLGLTFGLVWALLTLILWDGPAWTWTLLGAMLALRMAVALVVGSGTLRDGQVRSFLFLIPLRDVIALALWVISFTGHTVDWRGSSFTLKNGKLARIQS